MSGNKSPWGSGSGGSNGGSGGSGGGSGGGKGPWGSGGNNQRPRPTPVRQQPNPFEEMKKRFGSGGGNGPGGNGPMSKMQRFGPFGIILLGAVLYFLSTAVFIVDANEEGVVLRLGKYQRTVTEGLNFKLPNPFETKEIVDVEAERGFTIPASDDESAENLMLTGDENIVRIRYTVLWEVEDAADYLFNVKQVPSAVSDVAESAMREIVGKTDLQPLTTDERGRVGEQVADLMQEMLDEYSAGVKISQVEINQSQEPNAVKEAFLEVIAAKQEAEQAILRARERENELIPKANADADKLIQEAEGYKEAKIAEATGDAARFVSIYEEYKLAPRVTRDRMYLETMEEVYGDAEKIILDDDGGTGVLPYLPLDQLRTPKTQ